MNIAELDCKLHSHGFLSSCKIAETVGYIMRPAPDISQQRGAIENRDATSGGKSQADQMSLVEVRTCHLCLDNRPRKLTLPFKNIFVEKFNHSSFSMCMASTYISENYNGNQNKGGNGVSK